jgi:hypothetical protein
MEAWEKVKNFWKKDNLAMKSNRKGLKQLANIIMFILKTWKTKMISMKMRNTNLFLSNKGKN